MTKHQCKTKPMPDITPTAECRFGEDCIYGPEPHEQTLYCGDAWVFQVGNGA